MNPSILSIITSEIIISGKTGRFLILEEDYIALTQKPDYEKDPRHSNELLRDGYIDENKLRFLRKYQVRAIERIQEEVKAGKDRFLFEMATGTGKTLTSAAVIKLFLRTGNARRVLFLVDRLELEDQANKAFKLYLHNDYTSSIYKENRDDWRRSEIVVSTVQSFLSKNKYKRLFAPTDFDLVISDEAHRSIGGNSRAVFEYFMGYKLGLTATPKDYLKRIDTDELSDKDPRELERRMLLDTNISIDEILRVLSITTFEISSSGIEVIKEDKLPGNWKHFPAPASTKDFGTRLLKNSTNSIFKIPSSVIVEEYNYLLNPLHADSKYFKIVEIKDFIYDLRIKMV